MNVLSVLSSWTNATSGGNEYRRTGSRRKPALRASIDRLEARALLTVIADRARDPGQHDHPGDQGYFSSVSGEGQVNSVAADSNGNFVVVWEGNGVDDPAGVFGRRFLADGTPQGPEFRVNTTTAGNQRAPVVAMADDGSFAVAWDTPKPGTTSNRPAVIARVFNANGSPRTGEVQVTPFSNRDGNFPTGIAMDAVGDFVVAIRGWSGDFGGNGYNGGIVEFQRVSAAGQLQGKLTQVYDANLSNNSAAVAMDAAGNFVVAWSGDSSIQAQRYDSAGKKLGSVITTGWDGNPSIARQDAGTFVIAGRRNAGVNGPTDPGAGVARFYDASGVPQGSAFDFAPTALPSRTGVAIDSQGNAIFTWGVTPEGFASSEVFASRFNPAGMPLEGAVQVNTTMDGDQGHPSVATTTVNGDFVVVWGGNGAGDTAGVFAQRFTTAAAPFATPSGVRTRVPANPTGGKTISLDAANLGVLELPAADLAINLQLRRSRR